MGGIGGIGAIDLGGDGDDVVGGFDGSARLCLVFVGSGFEAGDGDGRDILGVTLVSNVFTITVMRSTSALEF